jgi:putative nucleotidyltransferase with HDIG domain
MVVLRQPFEAVNLSWTRLTPDTGELASEALLMGLLMMLTILLIPLLESSFGLLTRARLMELADQERPLLRRLSSEAPGTFEHTLMICGLAEEGARAIRADVDLIKTGSLYHDVGKLHAPNWFIENQTGGEENPHTKLNDPVASAGVLQAHVDEGLKLARRYRLPRPIADFIPEHQTTVKRILEARLADGQLRQSGLSRAEVDLVMHAFVRVWRRMRHRRIPYPIPAKRSFSA